MMLRAHIVCSLGGFHLLIGGTVLSVRTWTAGFSEARQGSGSEAFYFNLWHNNPEQHELPSNVSPMVPRE